jgi:preprotein translocase subunit SecE
MKKQVKRYLTDLAGISLIIAAPLLGWLPGPGGIPLLIAGLALLAINNKWAEDILLYIKNKGENFAKIIFPSNTKYQLLHDVIAVFLLTAAVWIFIYANGLIFKALGFSLLILAISEFIYNRDRISRIKQLIISIRKNIIAFFKRMF